MKILKSFEPKTFDLAIYGLGFESRAITAFEKYSDISKKVLVVGYDVNRDKFSYQENKLKYSQAENNIFEGSESEVIGHVENFLLENQFTSSVDILIDITVMSRHRLASIICLLIDHLPKQSTLNVVYSLSEHIPPPPGATPIKHLCEISSQLSGSLGDLSRPTSVIFGLGYEKSKALGVANYFDSGFTYAFVPRSPISEFEEDVLKNNEDLIASIPSDHVFYYDVNSPYSTYLSLRSLFIAASRYSRPLLVPLGPKILAALSVFLGKEMYPELPVWRVSSGHTEVPVDRPPSGIEISFSIQL